MLFGRSTDRTTAHRTIAIFVSEPLICDPVLLICVPELLIYVQKEMTGEESKMTGVDKKRVLFSLKTMQSGCSDHEIMSKETGISKREGQIMSGGQKNFLQREPSRLARKPNWDFCTQNINSGTHINFDGTQNQASFVPFVKKLCALCVRKNRLLNHKGHKDSTQRTLRTTRNYPLFPIPYYL